MSTATTRTYSSVDAAELAGCTYRMLDYWCRIGTIEPSSGHLTGSGSWRRWTYQRVAVLAVVVRVGGHVQVGRLGQLVQVLLGWDVATWGDTFLLVDASGGVWRDHEPGAPSVATAVDLGAIAADLAHREASPSDEA